MRELTPAINEAIVTPEDVALGTEFVADVKKALKAMHKVSQNGISTPGMEFEMGFDNNKPSLILIPSPSAIIESRRQYHERGKGADASPPEIDEPTFLGSKIWAELDSSEGGAFKMTALLRGHEGNGVWYNDYYTFKPEDHTLALVQYYRHKYSS